MSDPSGTKQGPPSKPAPYKPAPYAGTRRAYRSERTPSIAALGSKVDLDVKASNIPPSELKKPQRPPEPSSFASPSSRKKDLPKIMSHNGVPIHRFMTSMIVHSPYVSNPARKPVRPPPPKFREKKPWETPTHRFITTMVVHSPWTPLPKKPTTQDKAMKTLHTASKLSKAGISVASASVARQSSILANKGVTKSKDVYAKTKEKYAARSASPTPVYTGAMLSGGQTDVVMADEHGVWPHMKMSSFLNHTVYVPSSMHKKYQYRDPVDSARTSTQEHPIPAHRFISSFQTHASHVPETMRAHFAYNPLEVTSGRNRAITTADGGHTVRVTEAPKDEHLPVVPANKEQVSKSPQLHGVADSIKNTWHALRKTLPKDKSHKKDKDENHSRASRSSKKSAKSQKSEKSATSGHTSPSVTASDKKSHSSGSSASGAGKPVGSASVEKLEGALAEPSTAPDYNGTVSNITSGKGEVPETGVVVQKDRTGDVTSPSSSSSEGTAAAGVHTNTQTDGTGTSPIIDTAVAVLPIARPDADGVVSAQVDSVPATESESSATPTTPTTAQTQSKPQSESAAANDSDEDEKFHDAKESFKKKGLFHQLSSLMSGVKKDKTSKSSKDNTPPNNLKPSTPSGTTPEPTADVAEPHEPGTTPAV